jgi:hypothetical protein
MIDNLALPWDTSHKTNECFMGEDKVFLMPFSKGICIICLGCVIHIRKMSKLTYVVPSLK